MANIFKCSISFILGVVLNLALSSKNVFKIKGVEEIEYYTPFVFTLSLNQITVILLITSIINFSLYFHFDYSKESQSEILKIFQKLLIIEFIVFSFIIGTQLISLNGNFNIEYFKHINWFILSCIVILAIAFFLAPHKNIEEKNKEKEKNKEEDKKELYGSRKVFLNTIEEYLKNMSSFSIIGDWGIGKTVLIENFFYGDFLNKKSNQQYKDSYHSIYIDTSIYGNNQKIIEKIENELDYFFDKNGILKNRKSFGNELFIQNNNFLKGLYSYLFSKESLDEIREKIKKKSKEFSKGIVICLDNIERLDSKERITNLFAIINEIIPEHIKKIYIYDEKEMIKIFSSNSKCFKKDEGDFIEYVSKYTFNKIEIKNIKIEEVYSDKKYLLDSLLDKLNNENFENEIEKNLKDYFEDYNSSQFSGKLGIKKESIKKQLMNPRYVENVLKYIGKDNNDLEEIKYKFEYKLIRDFFPTLDLDLIKGRYYFKSNLTKRGKVIETNTSQEEEILMLYLFKLDSEGYPENNIEIKNAYYESFYLNIDIKDTSNHTKLEELKKNPEKNLLDIIVWEDFLSDNSVKEICKFLNENKNKKYVISSSEDLRKLLYLTNLEEYFEILFKMIILNKNGKYRDGYSKDESLTYYHNILINSYLLKNENIQNLFQISNSKEETRKYLSLVPNDIINNKSKINTEDKDFKTYIENNSIKDYTKALKIKMNRYENILRDMNLYEKTEKSINLLNSFTELRIDNFPLENHSEEIDEYLFEKSKKEILEMIDVNKDLFILKGTFEENKINISRDNIDFYIKQLSLKREKKEINDGIDTILIEMYKFRDSK